MSEKVIIREGYPLEFGATFVGYVDTDVPGLPAEYTKARFVVRATADTSQPALIDVDQDSDHAEFTITHATGEVSVFVGATLTANLGVNDQQKPAFGELRLEHGTDPDRVIGSSFAVFLAPRVA